jgi:hypothetical protein
VAQPEAKRIQTPPDMLIRPGLGTLHEIPRSVDGNAVRLTEPLNTRRSRSRKSSGVSSLTKKNWLCNIARPMMWVRLENR